MKIKKIFALVPLVTLSLAAQAAQPEMPGFVTTVSCAARSQHGGHPADASMVLLGYWKETHERMFYVFSGDKLRVGLASSNVLPDASGNLAANITATDLDNGQASLYARISIRFGNDGLGAGVMESAFEQTEPYVLGSLELSGCRQN